MKWNLPVHRDGDAAQREGGEVGRGAPALDAAQVAGGHDRAPLTAGAAQALAAVRAPEVGEHATAGPWRVQGRGDVHALVVALAPVEDGQGRAVEFEQQAVDRLAGRRGEVE